MEFQKWFVKCVEILLDQEHNIKTDLVNKSVFDFY